MKYLNIFQIYLKSFNIIKYNFFLNKFTILNYIIFFNNLKKIKLVLYKFKKLLFAIQILNNLKIKISSLLNDSCLIFPSIRHSFFKYIQIYNVIQLRYNYILNLIKLYNTNIINCFNYISYLKLKILNFPVKLKKYTILKSPHIFKKFRDQYQINNYTCSLQFFVLDDFENLQNIVNNLRIKSFIEVSFNSLNFYLLND